MLRSAPIGPIPDDTAPTSPAVSFLVNQVGVNTLKAMATIAALATALVTSTADLQFEDVTIGAAEVTATLLATRTEAPCPRCGCLSRRIHSRYQGTLADLPNVNGNSHCRRRQF